MPLVTRIAVLVLLLTIARPVHTGAATGVSALVVSTVFQTQTLDGLKAGLAEAVLIARDPGPAETAVPDKRQHAGSGRQETSCRP